MKSIANLSFGGQVNNGGKEYGKQMVALEEFN